MYDKMTHNVTQVPQKKWNWREKVTSTDPYDIRNKEISYINQTSTD